jgi:elongation factor 1 alpha-like protein
MAHFSAADFFRDCPWLNVPSHRKADIMIEPLYPRLGLLGGAPEAAGKPSKLAQLAAARKKKEAEAAAASAAPSAPQSENKDTSVSEPRAAPLSLSERLAKAKAAKASEPSTGLAGLRRSGNPISSAPPLPAKRPSVSESEKAALASQTEISSPKPEPQPAVSAIRAAPSIFASIIVGNPEGPTMAEPSHFDSNDVDLLKIYGQDHAEPFDFAGPSPDDVVLNAQNTAKGLAIRKKS